jgi:SAM-dependent methyltransferase
MTRTEPLAPTSAFERWRSLVERRREQMDAAYEQLRRTSADFWTKRADSYQRRLGVVDESDPIVRRVFELLPDGGSVLDVGAGTGRFAVPIARHAGSLVAVEPSEDMAVHLRENVRNAGLENVELIERDWLAVEAELPAADVALCAHVLYPHAELERWLRTLGGHARVAVVLALMADWGEPPVLLDLWRRFHGEPRVLQPSHFDAYAALYELGIPANVDVYEVGSVMARFESLDEAVAAMREHLLLPETPDTDAVLRDALYQHLVTAEGGLSLQSRRIAAVVWWRT